MKAKDTRIMLDEVTFCSKDMNEQAEISFKAGVYDEAKRGMERCFRTYDDGKKAGIDEGYKRGLAMKPNPDGVYENGKKAGMQEVVKKLTMCFSLAPDDNEYFRLLVTDIVEDFKTGKTKKERADIAHEAHLKKKGVDHLPRVY